MSRIVVDTDVASYIFNWQSLAQKYVDGLRGSELILSFMTIADLRIGAISAGWVIAVASYSNNSYKTSNWSMLTTTYVRFGREFALMHELEARY